MNRHTSPARGEQVSLCLLSFSFFSPPPSLFLLSLPSFHHSCPHPPHQPPPIHDSTLRPTPPHLSNQIELSRKARQPADVRTTQAQRVHGRGRMSETKKVRERDKERERERETKSVCERERKRERRREREGPEKGSCLENRLYQTTFRQSLLPDMLS